MVETFGEHHALILAASVIGLLVTMVVGLLGWIFNRSLSKVEEAQKELKDSDQRLTDKVDSLKDEMNEDFVRRGDFAEFKEEIKHAFGSLTREVKDGFQRMYDKLDGKADKT